MKKKKVASAMLFDEEQDFEIWIERSEEQIKFEEEK